MSSAVSANLSSLDSARESFEACRRLINDFESLLHQANKLEVCKPEHFVDLPKSLCEQLANPFSIFVCGEFNSGKSSILNSLAGEKISEVGVLPTTKELLTLSSRNFHGLIFIDSPGLNAILKEHRRISEAYIRRADYVLFVTSAERPLTQFEADFLTFIKDRWHRKLIVVLNKSDLLETNQIRMVVDFVKHGLDEVLGSECRLFVVSAKSGDGLNDLRDSLLSDLTDKEMLKIKIGSPLKSIQSALRETEQLLRERQSAANTEQKAINKIQQLFDRRLADISGMVKPTESLLDALFSKLSSNLLLALEVGLKKGDYLLGLSAHRQDRLRSMLQSALMNSSLASELSAILNELLQNLDHFSQRIWQDMFEYIDGLPPLVGLNSEQQKELMNQSAIKLELQNVMLAITESVVAARQRLLGYGGAAVATGLGSLLVVHGLLQVVGIGAALGLGLFGFTAISAVRSRRNRLIDSECAQMKQTIQKVIVRAKDTFTESLKLGFERALSPLAKQSEAHVQALEELDLKLKELRQRVLSAQAML